MPLKVEVKSEVWPLKGAFTISRGSKMAANVVVVTVSDGSFAGRGEAVPYGRYGETLESVVAQIDAVAAESATRECLAHALPAGAARNALDCALWDLEAKRGNVRAYSLAGLDEPQPMTTAFTLSLDAPQIMAEKAFAVKCLPLLKLKLGGDGDGERMRAVRAARPDARLIVDANEAWTIDDLHALMDVAAECGVETIEQPLPADRSSDLRGLRRPVPLCADESVHTVEDLPKLEGLYDAINVKLDKAGGLTGALQLADEGRRRGFKIMIGSMVATSLAIAPAMLLSNHAQWLDLDGPLLLARDRDPAIRIENGVVFPPAPELWG